MDIQAISEHHKALAQAFEGAFAWTKQASALETQPIPQLNGKTLRLIANSLITQKILPPDPTTFAGLTSQ